MTHHYENVEVINFGSSYHGFGQAFIMWKYVGKEYDLDYVLLGPECFRPERDLRFNHTDDCIPHYLHARYILKDSRVELVEVIGDTYKKRMLHYYRFIPHLRYLRYDTEAPLFLKCLAPKGRKIKNPFYYYNNRPQAKEINNIYKILLSEMADSGTKIVVFDSRKIFLDLSQEINKTNLYTLEIHKPQDFPYLAAVGHLNPLGNQLIAQQIYDYLTGNPGSDLALLQSTDIEPDALANPELEKLKLSEYDSAGVELNGIPFGGFAQSQKKLPPAKDLKKLESVSLLALKDKNKSILEAAFIPVDFQLREGMMLTLRIEREDDKKEYHLGAMKLLNPAINIGSVTVDEKITFGDYKLTLHFGNKNHLAAKGKRSLKGCRAYILLDKKPILYGNIKRGNGLTLSPLNNNGIIAIRFSNKNFSVLDGLDVTGMVTLSLTTPKGENVKIPLARLTKYIKKLRFLPRNDILKV